MKTELITDLDSLVIKVRNSNTKVYISEALASFRAGSNRGAILSTWIALSYDILSKIREIAADDPGAPAQFINDFDKASTNNNKEKLLKLERELLHKAKDLEIINNHEFHALERLKEDRHRCAHPTHDNEDDLFIPSPEQVRAHLVHCLNYVLTQKPVQGKKAIDRLISDLQNSNFLNNYEDTHSFLKSRYLNRSKEVFISNSIKLLSKSLLKNSVPELHGLEEITFFALKSFYRDSFYEAREIMRLNVNNYLDTSKPISFIRLPQIISIDKNIWNFLSEDNQIAFKGFVNSDEHQILKSHHTYECFEVPAIKELVTNRLNEIEDSDLLNIINKNPIKYFLPIIVYKFCNETTYSTTRDFGYKLAGTYSKYITVSDLKQIISCSMVDDQIYGYSNFDTIILSIFRETKDRLLNYTKDEWKSLAIRFSSIGELKTTLTQEGIEFDDTQP